MIYKEMLSEVAKTDRKKADEMQVAIRFIRYHNKTYGTDFVLSKEQPLVDNLADVWCHSMRDNSIKRELQITVAHANNAGRIGKESTKAIRDRKECYQLGFLQVTNPGQVSQNILKIVDRIREKMSRYSNVDDRKKLTLLLDGWFAFGFTNKDSEELKRLFCDSLKEADFKEIWLVNMSESYKLYPLH